MKNQIRQSILFFLFTVYCYSCIPQKENKDYSAYTKYLDVDSIYKTSIEKRKYEELKDQFLKVWLDKNNCFTDNFHLRPDEPLEESNNLKKIQSVEVDNILHTTKYDTVIVLVSFCAAWIDEAGEKKGEMTYAQAMKAVIDTNNSWHFNCDYGSYWVTAEGCEITKLRWDYRRVMIAHGCLGRNHKIDPDFFYKFFATEIKELEPKTKQLELPESGPVR